MKYMVYKITRDDGQLYIGTTYKDGFDNRMCTHNASDRFKGYTFEVDVELSSDDYDYIQKMEVEYIQMYDTYNNGLNESIDGKGNHLSPNFTTKGYKFSDESRAKMSKSAKKRIERDGVPFKGCRHKQETKDKWSKLRKGRLPPSTKLTEDVVRNILTLYLSHPDIDNVGIVMRNGKKMSYLRSFAIRYSDGYGVTVQCIEAILKGRTWKNVHKEFNI